MAQERTHQATPRQRQRFAQRGEIAKSRDLTTTLVLLATSGGIAFSLSGYPSLLGFAKRRLGDLNRPLDATVAGEILQTFATTVASPLVAALAAVLLAATIPARGRLPWVAIKLDFSRLNPLPKLQELFFSLNALTNLGASLVKVGVVGAVCGWTLYETLPAILSHSPTPYSGLRAMAMHVLLPMSIRCTVALLALSAVDFGLNWVKLERKMKMTTQELKDEQKEDMGDPHVKQRRRRRAQELARERSINAVPAADVVVVNPTHFAVALKYHSAKMQAPTVVAKGADRQAERIRALARRSGVPVVSQPPLTRALFRAVPLGKEIPAELYQAVAVVLSHVYRIRGRVA